MKNIKIATLWSSGNYGAYLQAYALQSFLGDNGYNVSFIKETDSHNKRSIKAIIYGILCSLGLLGVIRKYNYLLSQRFKKYHKKFKFSTLNDRSYATILGSDEIWNAASPYFQHLPIYVGVGANAERVISYAPSSNFTTVKQFVSVYGENPFVNIDRISVRDVTTKLLVDSLLSDGYSEIVSDPTFLLENYNQLVEPLTINDDYLLVYGYTFTEDEIIKIKSLSQAKGLKIISAGPYISWADKQLPLSPGGFLSLVKGATYIVTSTFHGTVFSILFNKQFVSFARYSNKINDLLVDMNLELRNVSIHDFHDTINDEIDYDVVNKLIEEKRRYSRTFLLKSLS